MVIVLEFSQGEEVMLIVLLFTYKELNILVRLLVNLFSLSVGLQMPIGE